METNKNKTIETIVDIAIIVSYTFLPMGIITWYLLSAYAAAWNHTL